ncbi:PREDICTED: uncharacterized protein LOC100642131 [Amphimedon queenslandica]|uniref:DDT domain-containing protein n=1 Tax=Amphimedon queenslandica TaxID=400682 RepID=A0AAN0IXK5_AMPQE|nr:PREDICTED: uncharacterized protein LOC100642131 [Amphimedon queenslandica]|eukprot:XP_019849176.1 PREDICTED: uncharacterized protein LOC100642131 [Amphimedon queenslandica]
MARKAGLSSSSHSHNGVSSSPKKTRKRPQCPRGQSQSCHQCRQSIFSLKGASEIKTGQKRIKCSKCTRYWCEKCLSNRYGLERLSLSVTSWLCPVCSGNCNCSLCRKKSGKLATGVLIPLVKTAGFTNVSEFLQKGTDDVAKCLQWQSPINHTMSTEIQATHNSSKKRKYSKKEDKEYKPPSSRSQPKPEQLPHKEHCVISHTNYSITMNIDEAGRETVEEETDDKENFDVHQISFEGNSVPSEATPTRCLRNRTLFTPCETSRKLLSPKRSRRQKPVPKRVVRVQQDEEKLPLDDDILKKEEKLREIKEKKEMAVRERKAKKLEEKRERQKTLREEALRKREEKKKVLQEAMAKKREEKQLKLDKIRKAKLLLKEAKQQQIRQMEELREAMRKRKEEERNKKLVLVRPITLPSLPSTVVGEQPVLPLPSYPPLELGVAGKYVSSLIFVAEFLNTFKEILGTSDSINLDSFCTMLRKRVYPANMFDALLTLISSDREGESAADFKKEWTTTTAEEYAKRMIMSSSENDMLNLSFDVLESRIQLLHYLCTLALDTSDVIDAIKRGSERHNEEKRAFRNKKNELIQKSMETLKSLSEGGASIDELALKREEFTKELQELHQVHNPVCSSTVRHEPLGTDRHDRLYWSISTLTHVILVEDREGGVWSVININNQLLQQVLNSLDLSDKRESLLQAKLYKIISSNETKMKPT